MHLEPTDDKAEESEPSELEPEKEKKIDIPVNANLPEGDGSPI